MGVYLNSKNPFGLFFQEAAATYFVDKSGMLRDLIPLVTPKTEEGILQEGIGGKGNRFLCVTRPRRFGKTVMASMIASFSAVPKAVRNYSDHWKSEPRKDSVPTSTSTM